MPPASRLSERFEPMSLSRYKRVVVLCPAATTGGPEAIHQLAYGLNSAGIECYVAYYGLEHRVRVAPDRLHCDPPGCERLMTRYARYFPRVLDEIALDPSTLVILPEPLARQTASFRACGVAVWWLSVDNAFINNPDFRDREKLRAYFQDREIHHLYQSVYAREWLRANGATRIYDLGDYTSEMFTLQPAKAPSPRVACAYNAAKGSDIAQQFFAGNPGFDALPLKGYSRDELRAIFSERLFYVDFGHMPGKDRLPREAAACGSIVFVHRKGAGRYYDDFPIPDFFKFDLEDVTSGELARRLRQAADAPAEHWAMQGFLRDTVLWERTVFGQQIMRHWGLRPAG
jgi:hypothetical protein